MWAHEARVRELPRRGRVFANNSTSLSAPVAVGSHHNDVIVGKPCSIRFSAARVVLVNGLNQQRRSPEPRLFGPEMFGPERVVSAFSATIGDGLPTQASTTLKRLAGCQSTFYCGTDVPGDQCRSIDPSQHTF